jgi:hypothetical protein
MPRGPQGQKRPADLIGCAVMVARIATGEVKDEMSSPARMRRASAGGKARNEKLSGEARAGIAKKAAAARWRSI